MRKWTGAPNSGKKAGSAAGGSDSSLPRGYLSPTKRFSPRRLFSFPKPHQQSPSEPPEPPNRQAHSSPGVYTEKRELDPSASGGTPAAVDITAVTCSPQSVVSSPGTNEAATAETPIRMPPSFIDQKGSSDKMEKPAKA